MKDPKLYERNHFFPISNFDLKLGCRYCNGGWHWGFGERDSGYLSIGISLIC